LLFGFGGLIALLGGFFLLLTIRLHSIENSLEEQANVARPRADEARQLEINLLKYALEITEFARTSDERFRDEAMKAAGLVDLHLHEYERLISTDEQRRLAEDFAAQWREIHAMGREMLMARSANTARADLTRFEALRLRAETFLNSEMEADASAAYISRLELTVDDVRRITSLAIILLFIGIIIVVTTSTIVGTSIVGTETDLRDSEQKYRGLFGSIDEGFCIVEIDYDPEDVANDYRFVEASPSFEKQSGLCGAVGKKVSEMMPTEKRFLLETFAEVATDGEPRRFESRSESLGRWYEVYAFPFGDPDGRQVAVLFKDISERKNEENRIALLARLGELMRMADDVDEFLGSVAGAVGKAFGARRCLFNEIDLATDTEMVHSDYVDGVESVTGEHKVSDYSSITASDMAAGRTVVNRDSQTDTRTANLYETVYGPAGERAYVAVPMMRAGQWVASLFLSTDEPRNWNADDVRLLEGIAERAWLATEKLRAAEALERSRDELEMRVTERTAQLMTTLDQLKIESEQRLHAETERTNLLDQLVSIQEDERRRIARDLHDELGQQLTALRLNLGNAREIAKHGPVTELIDATQKIAENLDADIGFLAWELRPATLDHSGLGPTLSAYIREWSRFSSVKADFLVQSFGTTRLEKRVELNLYRIVQEALNNVSKYANAQTVSVLLEKTEKHISLIIEDDGLGFDAQAQLASVDGLGLIGMRERAAIIGGSLIIESAPGRGTTVFVRVPFDPLIHIEESKNGSA